MNKLGFIHLEILMGLLFRQSHELNDTSQALNEPRAISAIFLHAYEGFGSY